jgi:hypothetical protein
MACKHVGMVTKPVADRRMILAGYRLADLLVSYRKSTLVGFTVGSRSVRSLREGLRLLHHFARTGRRPGVPTKIPHLFFLLSFSWLLSGVVRRHPYSQRAHAEADRETEGY